MPLTLISEMPQSTIIVFAHIWKSRQSVKAFVSDLLFQVNHMDKLHPGLEDRMIVVVNEEVFQNPEREK